MKKLQLTICVLLIAVLGAFAQESTVKVKVKAGSKPDIYIDGIKYDHAILDVLDEDKIAEMRVFKGDKAIEKYNAPNGVIVITTKKSSRDGFETQVKVRKSKGSGLDIDDEKYPAIIIDGKAASKKELSELSPEDIQTIDVKGKDGTNPKYPNGVVVVETKGAKKKKN